MNNFSFMQKTPPEIAKEIANKIKWRRKRLKISQSDLAQRSGVSLGSIKRFETKHEIAFSSLIKLAIALDFGKDFDDLFVQKTYSSIAEVINENI